MSLVRLSFVACLLLAGVAPGCGEGSTSTPETQAPPSEGPGAGDAAAKKIMDMQPPPPSGKKARH